VFLLHDATEGRVRPPDWLQPIDGHPVVDLGPTPEAMLEIPAVRPRAPRRSQGRLPVDAIPYAVLAALLGQALAEGIPFADVLAATAMGDATDGGSSWYG
jgi:hypothetical protein